MPTPPSRSRQVTPASRFTEAWFARVARTPTVSARSASCDAVRGDVVLVVVAHPDDETLAMGATLADLSADGVDVHVLSLSSGEAALDAVGVHVDGLGGRRRGELAQAGARLRLHTTTVLDLPDGELAAHPEEVAQAVSTLAARHRPTCLLTLWRHDPHPDHQAVSRAVAEVAGLLDLSWVEFALWAVHWTDPDDVPHHALRVVATTQDGRRAREAAISEYRTQIEPLAEDLQAILPAEVLQWPHECVVG